MQGRQGSGKEPREWFVSPEPAAVNGRGKHRAIPQRPPGMTRVDQAPAARRVARSVRFMVVLSPGRIR